MCKGSWHGAAVTEGLLPQLWFFSISKRRSRSPGFVSAQQLSSVPKTALLSGSSGKAEAPGHRSVFSFPDLSRIRLRKSIPQSRFARQLPLSARAPLCKGSWHGAAVTEGLLPQLWFFSISKRRSRSPGFVSAQQLSSVPKTALLSGSSGKAEAPGHRSVFSFPDLSRIRLRKSIPQSRFARQLPLHKGAYTHPQASPVQGEVAPPKAETKGLPRQQWVIRACRSVRLRRLSGTAIPQSRCPSTAPFAQGSLLRIPKPPLCKGRWLHQRRSRKGCPSAVRFPGVPVYPAALHIRDSNPSVSLRSTAPFTQGSPDCRQNYRQCIQLHGLSAERGRKSPFCAQSMLIQEYF